jgi:rRNA-processing protein FCF1
MKILIDTNFILTAVKQKIDIEVVAAEIIDEDIHWIVPQQVLNELGNLKDAKGMKSVDRQAAALSFDVLQQIAPEVVDVGRNPNVDIGIVNYIMDKDIVLATLDRGLQDRVKNKMLTIRGKKFLELK